MKALQLGVAKLAWLQIPVVLGVMTATARAEWQREEHSLSWHEGTNVVWRFCFDPGKGKPYFDPIAIGATCLTNFKPEDHPWHYGLWFSWKYINHANYWEEDRQTGKAQGATRWDKPFIETKSDGSAIIKLNVTYTHPSGRVDLSEQRELRITAPRAGGSYEIDWQARFIAGPEGAVLDRTPMPDEPDGKVNGGYAGLGVRLAPPPLGFSAVCSTGTVTRFVADRARPNSPAMAFNFSNQGRDAGGLAIFSDPLNAGENAPWYVVNSSQMRFGCAAILAPKILTLKAGETMKLHYRLAVSPKAWTTEALVAGQLR